MFIQLNICRKTGHKIKTGKRLFRFASVLLSGLIIMVMIGSCNNSQKPVKKQSNNYIPQPFEKAKILENVKALKDTAYRYAIYLPENYQSEKQTPVVFFFDAHARGVLPIKKYHLLADKYGWILAGSNNSKNGQTAGQRNAIIYHFMEDVEQRCNINPDRIYTAGFSGGARIASGICLYNKNIAGVIACAAGLPQTNRQPNTTCTLIGIVGNKDFNYLEMKALNNELSTLGLQHSLLVFDGKHEWPPFNVMDEAFTLLQLSAMQQKKTVVSKSVIKHFVEKNDSLLQQAETRGNFLQAATICQKIIDFTKGLQDISSYQKRLIKLTGNQNYRKQQQQFFLIKKEETKTQQVLARAMEAKNSSWWKQELYDLINKAKIAGDQQRLMNRRLLNYLSLISYLYADRALKNNQTKEAQKFLMIYKLSDPGNPEVYFLRAELFSMTGKNSQVLFELEKAAAKGFSEPGRLNGNKYFKKFINEQNYSKIVREMRVNKNDK